MLMGIGCFEVQCVRNSFWAFFPVSRRLLFFFCFGIVSVHCGVLLGHTGSSVLGVWRVGLLSSLWRP